MPRYDEFNRLTSQTTYSGAAVNVSWVYDRYGNRRQQNPNGAQLAFNTSNNQISGYSYDVAGNLLSDGVASYSYDAEGNVIQTLNGVTNNITYNALNQEVRLDYISSSLTAYNEYVFNLSGQVTSVWDAGIQSFGTTYWDGLPIEAYLINFGTNGAFFPHFNWNSAKRLTTDSTGATYGIHSAMPFGDDFVNVTGHRAGTFDDFGGMWDGTSSMHAQFRDYNPPQGRWHSPDPYDGSYDFSNPQSLNRYSYVLNNPLSAIDPSGLFVLPPPPPAAGCPVCLGVIAGIDLVAGLGKLFGWWGGPSFHGTLKPRPEGTGNPDWANANGGLGETLGLPSDVNWSKINPGIAGALGLPDAGCEFGACGGVISSFQQQNPSTNPQVSLLPPLFLLKLRDLYPWNWGGGDSNLVPGTHYCGPGGWGQPTGKVDIACQAHDLCYNSLHINAAMNVLGIVPDSAKSGQAACDQQLCNAISSSRLNQQEMGQALAVQGYFGCH